jgi:PAS domain S-box-containing protein
MGRACTWCVKCIFAENSIFNVLFAALSPPIITLIAVGLVGIVAAGLLYLFSKRSARTPVANDTLGADAAKLENYQLILDTLERSNVLLWWARVTREGPTYDWKIRIPPQLRDNPIYRLAALVNEGGLWRDEQAPDHERTKLTAATAFAEGASGYQQEFPIIGLDGMHWLSEEVIIRPEGLNEWNLAGVIVDVTKRHEAEAKYRSIFEHSREGILLTTPGGRVLAANPALARILGYESVDSFMREETSGVKSRYADIRKRAEMVRLLQESGKVVDFEARMRRKDGTLIWALLNIQVVQDKQGEQHYEGTLEDVTERKRAQDALAESERKYRELVEHANSIILRWTRGGVITFLNEFGQEFFGYTEKEILGRHVVGTIISSESETTSRDLRQLMDQIGTHSEMFAQTVYENTRRNGERVWVTWTNKPVLDEHGQTREILSIGFDITERRRAEEALRHEQALFNSLTSTIPDHIYFKDRQSRFIRINGAMARSFELRDVAEAVGKTDFDIFSEEHALQSYTDEQRIMETGEPMIGVEEKETWPDGHVTWVSTTKMPLRDAQGCITGLVGISRDITERKIADAQLREQNEILSKSHEGVMIVNLANEITLWNRGAEEIFGWTAAEALGRLPEQVLGVEDLNAFSELRATVERDGFWNGEMRLKDRDGRNLIVDDRITLIRDEVGRPRARLSFLANITEKKLLEEKFFHAQRLETVGMLAAGIAHDLNNVLAPVMFAAPLLRDSLSTPRDLKILDMLTQCAARGAGLVKQILGFAHSTAGEVQPTQVKHIARDIISVIEETFPKSIELQQTIPSDLWPVLGNATQIHQVLLNLCVNARDAMPQGGALRITAANRRLDAAEAGAIPGARPGAWLVLEVADTGTGIPPEVLEQIWTPFFTTKGIGKGTGLGLSTVRGIVLNHHGFTELHTDVGRGTTFRVFLPAVEGESPQTISASPFDIPDGHGELILLVDDNAPIRDMGTTILEKHGYRVVSCVDGVEAILLFIARAGEISLVITDVDMPRLGGTELARTLSQIRPDIRLLAISGLPGDEADGPDVLAAKKVTHAFLPKPFKAVDLLGAVSRLLHPSEKPKLPGPQVSS